MSRRQNGNRRTVLFRPRGGGSPYKFCVAPQRAKKNADIWYKFLMICRPSFLKKGYVVKKCILGIIFSEKQLKNADIGSPAFSTFRYPRLGCSTNVMPKWVQNYIREPPLGISLIFSGLNSPNLQKFRKINTSLN